MKNIVKNIGIMLISTVIMIIAMEFVVLRNVIKDPNSSELGQTPDICTERSMLPYDTPNQCYGTYDLFPVMKYHPYLVFEPRADYSGNGYYTNSLHFRAEEFELEKSDNQFRIFVTGGSTAWGAGVNQEQLYTYLLESMLEEEYPEIDFQVISTGVGVYSSVQERIMVENRLRWYDPDIVMMLSGWNDVFFGYIGQNIFEEQNTVLVSEIFEPRMFVGADGWQLDPDYTDAEPFFLSPPVFSDYDFVSLYLIDQVRYRLFANTTDVQTEIAQVQTPTDELANIIISNIEIVDFIADQADFDFVYYLQPSLYSVNKPLGIYEEAILANMEQSYLGLNDYHTEGYAVLQSLLRDLSIQNDFTYRDGNELFVNEVRDVFADHVHLGDRGNRILAEDMLEILIPLIDAQLD